MCVRDADPALPNSSAGLHLCPCLQLYCRRVLQNEVNRLASSPGFPPPLGDEAGDKCPFPINSLELENGFVQGIA